MTTQAEETDVVDREVEGEGTEDEQVEQVEGEQSEDQQTEAEQGSQTEDEEVVVTIGEESPPSEEEEDDAPGLVNRLRKIIREKERLLRDAEKKHKTDEKAEQGITVGQKPTLAECDYDEERFESELSAWHERKREVEQQEAKKREAAEAEQKAWQAKLTAYDKAKTELKVSDFEDAEENAKEIFNVTQQGVVLHGAENPALLVYALGKNPKKAKELASITDPVKFAFAVAKLESQLKVTPRKAAPVPEKTVRGSAPVSGTVDKTLENLEAEAERTGDRSKVIAYRRQLRRKET